MSNTGPRLVTSTTRSDVTSWPEPLAAFIAEQVGGPVELTEVSSPSGSGMSGISLLFTATWADPDQPETGERTSRRLVARVMPHPDDLPVFPISDVEREAAVMTAARVGTGLPVPEVFWTEPSGQVIGMPFMIVEAVPGSAPPDNPPYLFGGWLASATAEEQRRLETSTVDVLARVHAAPAPEVLRPAFGDTRSALRAHLDESIDYYRWMLDGGEPIPVLEDGFTWLEENFPDDDREPVFLWGDSRIGNILYTDFTPTGVLDWEYARYGPREADLAWLICFHAMFQDLAETHGHPGMPGFLQRARIEEDYAAASGHTPAHMDFHLTYAAVRHGVIMSRIARRSILLGDREPVENLDELVLHHKLLRKLLDGTHRWA
ncbi:phosphotransferase family protein [Enemella sp. A6]|uniref:phosphotransferase family protein n=1 Tax=Enemella sp. A6 TaxID=3440152 RepID=UPI003EBFA1A0